MIRSSLETAKDSSAAFLMAQGDGAEESEGRVKAHCSFIQGLLERGQSMDEIMFISFPPAPGIIDFSRKKDQKRDAEETEGGQTMTMAQIRASDKETLTPQDIAQVLGAHPQWIRETARRTPELMGFRFTFSGKRMIIPRAAFVNWFDGK